MCWYDRFVVFLLVLRRVGVAGCMFVICVRLCAWWVVCGALSFVMCDGVMWCGVWWRGVS